MKRTRRFATVFIVVTFLSLFLALPSASAAASEVWVNNVKLDSSAYYLANGSGTATTTKPASGGYVYFNASAGTLTLYNAQLNTPHLQSYESLLFANGDLTIILTGTNTLQYTATSTSGTYMGIYVQGLLTVTGSGSAAIQMNSTSTSGAVLYGIYSHDMKIESGTLSAQVSGYGQVFGIDSYFDILITGGSITLNCEGVYAIAVLAQAGDFTMSGGSVTATSNTEANAMGLSAGNLTLICGEGTFSGFGADNSEGGYINANNGAFTVLGGHFIFKGSTSALRSGYSTYTTSLNNITTYVSASSSGSGKSLWKTAADGVLVKSPAAVSPFRYAEFIGPDCYAVPPQTGDSSAPWLWAGMALFALLFAAEIFRLGCKSKGKRQGNW